MMRTVAALMIAVTILAGCATTPDEIVKDTPIARWSFAQDYSAVSDCLVRAINFEARLNQVPASHIETVVPTKVNDITQTTSDSVFFVVRVENTGPASATATAFKIRTLKTGIPEMVASAAKTCAARS